MRRISVGVSFPIRLGTVTAIWPFGLLVIGATELAVDVRPQVFKRFLLHFVDSEGPGEAPLWEASWNELAPVDLGPRSVILHTDGSRGCRVVFVGRGRLRLLLDELSTRHIVTRRVKTTFGWYFR